MIVRVLLLEDHVIFRELFASAFEGEPGFEVVAQAGTLAGARQALEDLGSWLQALASSPCATASSG